MIPHIQEHEDEISGLGGYPIGTLTVVLGYMLVLFVERVIFDVNGALSSVFRKVIPLTMTNNNIFLDLPDSSRPREVSWVS